MYSDKVRENRIALKLTGGSFMKKLLKSGIIISCILIGLTTFSSTNLEEEIQLDPTQNEKELVPFKKKYRVTENITPISPLTITSKDILWEFGESGTYIDLIIRKKRWLGSVMLTNMYYGEKYVHEYGDKAYGLRSRTYNSVNRRETRIVNNKRLGHKQSLYFLVDSHPERHRLFGLAFRIRIPKIVEYGYKTLGDNYGIISVEKGVTLNLRTYIRKYADHRGRFENNPLHIDFSERDYNKMIKPEVFKIKEYMDGSYKVVMIKYISRLEYVKYFLIRDIHVSKNFRRISFSTTRHRRHKTAVVLRAVRKQGIDTSITALIYFKKGSSEKDYDISAIDQRNRIAKNYISTTVPQTGKLIIKENLNKMNKKETNETIIFNENNSNDDNNFFLPNQ